MLDLLLIKWVTKMKPGSNSVEDHPTISDPSKRIQSGHTIFYELSPTSTPRRKSNEKCDHIEFYIEEYAYFRSVET
jgi:hypothetical protein